MIPDRVAQVSIVSTSISKVYSNARGFKLGINGFKVASRFDVIKQTSDGKILAKAEAETEQKTSQAKRQIKRVSRFSDS
jgi:hypothetical protein